MTLSKRFLAAAALAAAIASPAAAQSSYDFSNLQQARATAPACRGLPADETVVGRVVGFYGTRPARSASIVGCFYDPGECNRWTTRVSGLFSGRIIRADCRSD